ncbi:MAG: hypothetical protein JEZ09_21560 [Salinivirgaceae bacterium]|nr:hypothetical protein [Salinivirgaceae bacterium]
MMRIMNAMELKSDLHQLIERANDLSILQAVKVILSKESIARVDWADTLSETLKEELEASVEEADQGKTISHADAMQQIKNRYNH